MEQAVLRQRELIPIYVVPYEMIPPETWDKMPDNIYRDKNEERSYVCSKEKGKNYLSRKNYEDITFPTWELFFSTTPFGRPYPTDELITYMTLQIKKYEPMSDKHFIFVIYKYNKNTDPWTLMYHHMLLTRVLDKIELLEDYKTTFYINEKYRYDPIAKHDIIKDNNKNIWRVTNEVLTTDMLYIKDGNEYKPAKTLFGENYENLRLQWKKEYLRRTRFACKKKA